MKSRHGGSEESGLVLPAGMGEMVNLDGSTLFEPPEVTAARKQAAERAERALNLERRRIALEVLPALIRVQSVIPCATLSAELLATSALSAADALIAKTGGGI